MKVIALEQCDTYLGLLSPLPPLSEISRPSLFPLPLLLFLLGLVRFLSRPPLRAAKCALVDDPKGYDEADCVEGEGEVADEVAEEPLAFGRASRGTAI